MSKKQVLVFSVFLFTLSCLFQSCATKRGFVYFSNLPDSTIYSEAITNQLEPTIEPNDILSIRVATLSSDANALYNSGSLPDISGGSMSSGGGSGVGSSVLGGYLVDAEGYITFPILGKVKVAGLTQSQVQNILAQEIAKTTKAPIVNVQIMNFKITVIGEVGHSGTFNVPSGRVTVLEALGMAGDMTPLGLREQVLVIREKDGRRTMERINMTDKNVFSNPYFYLQQNDIVYVQADNKVKARNSDPTRYQTWSMAISSISFLFSVTVTIIALSRQ